MREIRPANFFKPIIHIYPTRLWRDVLDLFFPRYCFGCRKEKTRLCPSCLSNLPRSFSSGEDKIFSVFDYNSPIIKQAIWSLKYKRAIDLAETFARALSDTLFEELAEEMVAADMIVLIPTPLSSARQRTRGYNQAEELAKQMMTINPGQFLLEKNLVRKTKDTPTQVSLRDRAKRLANLKNAFSLKTPIHYEKNQIFVIIDDVATTGTTIGEVRRLLEKAGYYRVYGLVLAHG